MLVLRRAVADLDLEAKLLGHGRNRVEQEYCRGLPGVLDRIDQLLADGVIGGEVLTVADYQIAATVRLLLNLEDLRAGVESALVRRTPVRVVPMRGHARRALGDPGRARATGGGAHPGTHSFAGAEAPRRRPTRP